MNDESKIVGLIVVIVICVIGTIVLVTPNFDGRNGSGFALFKEDLPTLVANVKGSIYAPDEVVSLFGTCFDADDNPVNATAYLSAWYPDGSPAIRNYTMTQFQLGHYLYTANMNTTNGTYLTMLECQYQGMSALAYGEWQNPLWVRKILDIENDTSMIEADFNLTFDFFESINSTLINVSAAIQGNLSSMDLLIRGIAKTLGACVDCNLTAREYYREPLKYWKNWHIYVKVVNEYGKDVTSVVRCNITTSEWGFDNLTFQEEGVYLDDDGDDGSNFIPKYCPEKAKYDVNDDLIEPTCPRMYYGHKVDFKGNLSWNISCGWMSKI